MRKYSMESLKKAVEDYLTGSRTQKEVALEHHISQSTLSSHIKWMSFDVARAVNSVASYLPDDELSKLNSIWTLFDDAHLNSSVTNNVVNRVSNLVNMSPETVIKLIKIYTRS